MTLQKVASGLLLIALIAGLVYKGYEEYKITKADPPVVQDEQVLGGLEVGRKAPDFVLPTLEGQEVSLGMYEGKTTVLNFWASWCPPCREEFPELIAFGEKTGVPVIGVNVTKNERRGKTDVEAFIEEVPVPFPILLDETGKTEQAYRVVALPTTYVIDGDGVILAKHTGPVDEAWLLEKTGLSEK